MKYKVFAYKNDRLGCYCTPVFEDRTSEVVASNVTRSIQFSLTKDPEETASKFKGMQFCEIGTYDDETGKLESIEPVVLVDCESLISNSKAN